MPIDSHYNPDSMKFTIKVIGRFDYGEVNQFSNALKLITPKMRSITIDLDETQYIDSSALGMLLALLKMTMANQQTIKIINVKQSVAKALVDANFHKLFRINIK